MIEPIVFILLIVGSITAMNLIKIALANICPQLNQLIERLEAPPSDEQKAADNKKALCIYSPPQRQDTKSKNRSKAS